jgi:hypothetical protein
LLNSLELPPRHFLGLRFSERPTDGGFVPFPGFVYVLSLGDGWFDPCPGISLTPGACVVYPLSFRIEFVHLTVKLQLTLTEERLQFCCFSIIQLGVLNLGVARGEGPVELLENLIELRLGHCDRGYHS